MPRTILSVDGKVMGATNSSDFQVNVQEKLVRKYKEKKKEHRRRRRRCR